MSRRGPVACLSGVQTQNWDKQDFSQACVEEKKSLLRFGAACWLTVLNMITVRHHHDYAEHVDGEFNT